MRVELKDTNPAKEQILEQAQGCRSGRRRHFEKSGYYGYCKGIEQ